jgi:sugar/nucleoside kinase (ribokinase family)
MEKLQIIGLGLATIDILMRLEEMPAWEKFNYLQDLKFEGGGPAGTALVAAARLGARAGFIGTAGNDPAGDLKVDGFRREGVDTAGLVRRPFPEDQVALVFVHARTGERTFAAPLKFGQAPLRPEELDRAYLTAADLLHLDGFHFEAALQAASWMRAAGKQVVLDAGKTTGSLDPRLPELVRMSDVAICAAGVVEFLTGIADLAAGAQEVLRLGPRVVVETRGEAGSHTFTRDEAFHTPAFQVNVVDTTGAGDVFHGAYAAGLLQGWDLRRVARFASAAAALKCTRLGGRAGIPTMGEVEEFLKGS